MKKILTLIAMALMTLGASAQTITFDAYADKTADGAADDLVIADGAISVSLDGGSKSKIAAKSLTFALATATTDAERETFGYQYCPGGGVAKTSGERSITIALTKAGSLYIYPRSAKSSATDRTMTVQQNGTALLDAVVVSDADQVTIGEKTYFKAFKVEVAAGTVNILTSDAINFSAFKFEATAGSGEQGGSASSVICASTTANATIPTGGTDCKSISFGSAETATFTITAVDDAFRAANVSSTNMDVRGVNIDGTNYDPIYFLSVSGTTSHKFNITKSANVTKVTMYARKNDGDATKTVTIRKTDVNGDAILVANGFGGELASADVTDVATLYVPAGTYIVFKVDYSLDTDGINTLQTKKVADGVMYNLQGQKVDASYKGVVIVNGKKVLNK